MTRAAVSRIRLAATTVALTAVVAAVSAETPASARQEPTVPATPVSRLDPCGEGGATLVPHERAGRIVELARELMEEEGLNALLLRVTVGGEAIVTEALGESIPGVPADVDMLFPSGMVVVGYLPTILLQEVEARRVSLDDPISKWLPDLRAADRVTLGMLAGSMSGYPDYVPDEAFNEAFYADPFRRWSAEELVEIAMVEPSWYEPGESFNYAHTNYLLLGLALEKITGRSLATLLEERIVEPLGLASSGTGPIHSLPGRALHTFTTDRGVYEESTHWTSTWHLGPAAMMATTLCDLSRSAVGIGSGALISPASYRVQMARRPASGPTATCPAEACSQPPPGTYFGLGQVVSNSWIATTPSFPGFASVHAYLPEAEVGMAIVATHGPDSEEGNHAQKLFVRIAEELTPEHVPFRR